MNKVTIEDLNDWMVQNQEAIEDGPWYIDGESDIEFHRRMSEFIRTKYGVEIPQYEQGWAHDMWSELYSIGIGNEPIDDYLRIMADIINDFNIPNSDEDRG